MAKAKSRKSTASQRQAQQRQQQPATTQAAQSQARASSASQQRPQSAPAQANQPQAQVRTSASQQRKQQQARNNQRKRVRSNWRPGVTVGSYSCRSNHIGSSRNRRYHRPASSAWTTLIKGPDGQTRIFLLWRRILPLLRRAALGCGRRPQSLWHL